MIRGLASRNDGCGRARFPEAYGGAGADAISVAIVIEEVARGEALFSYALSEPEAGSDAAAMRTRAVRTDNGYVLNGVKRWITNAGVSKYYTVMAVTDPAQGANGISAFVLEQEDEGFKIALRTLDHTRITIAAQALDIAQGALDYSLGYMKERKQFGQPIAEFQGLQFMIADMAMKLEAARQLTYAAAARSDRAMAGEHVADLTFMSSACKCLASDQKDGGWPPAPCRAGQGPGLATQKVYNGHKVAGSGLPGPARCGSVAVMNRSCATTLRSEPRPRPLIQVTAVRKGTPGPQGVTSRPTTRPARKTRRDRGTAGPR